MKDDDPSKGLFRNRWVEILPKFGLAAELLVGRHGPCPFCSGKDRFRFTNYRGQGDWICNSCGFGDGYDFVGRVLGVGIKEAIKQVEKITQTLGDTGHSQESFEPSYRSQGALYSIWKATKAPSRGDPVWAYLERRVGPLRAISVHLRYHPRLAYKQPGETGSFHPAMVAMVLDPMGKPTNFHRTYLAPDGRKAEVAHPKKLCPGSLSRGSAVRLAPADEIMGVAEGIETALAASILRTMPVWAAVSSHGLATWVPPPEARTIIIFGDHDKKFGGQAAAYALAQRLSCDEQRKLNVAVAIPEMLGTDWADVLSREMKGVA